ncbi:MAG: UPF0149 family protein [Betaproteobacteria bacterium]|nr:UPF0149 family protein [Betaproteobacteria bacterium]
MAALVWDAVLGEVEPEFENADDGMRMSTLVLRRYNAVVGSLLDNPAGFMPLYERGDRWGTTEWCEGFLLGTTLDEDEWDRLGAAHPDWIAAFERLGTEAGIDRILEDDDAERWIAEIVPALAKIHAHWADARAAQPGRVPEAAYDVGGAPHEPAMRTAPKVGRNDPCPCGSGKKYKKCCMAKGHGLAMNGSTGRPFAPWRSPSTRRGSRQSPDYAADKVTSGQWSAEASLRSFPGRNTMRCCRRDGA